VADCFLFFRFWPGFSEPFPFDRFNGIAKDEELSQALDSWAREEIRRPEARRAIMQVARWRKQEWRARLAATQKRRGVVASRPGRFPNDASRRSPGTRRLTERDVYWPRIRQPERPEPLICRFGFDLGWWRQVWDDPIPFGPRVWFYKVPSSELAEAVVSALNGRTDRDYEGNEVEHTLRPRFGFVEDADITLQVEALPCIDAIRSGKAPDVRGRKCALAMGQKAMAIADEILKAVAPPKPVQAVSAPPAVKPEPSAEPGGAGSTPEEAAIARKAAWDHLPKRARNAYLAFQYAAEQNGVKPQDLTAPDAHTWLRENGIDQERCDPQLTDYKVPKPPGNFQRYLCFALHALGENKYTPRAGRAAGSSVVKDDKIEYQRGDDG